jgi:hypothetical protein
LSAPSNGISSISKSTYNSFPSFYEAFAELSAAVDPVLVLLSAFSSSIAFIVWVVFLSSDLFKTLMPLPLMLNLLANLLLVLRLGSYLLLE